MKKFLFLSLLASSLAIASTETTMKSETNADFTKKLYGNYFSFFHAPSINNPFINTVPDNKGSEKNPVYNVYFDNTVSLGYKFSKDVGLGADICFMLEPVFDKKHNFTMNDSGIKFFDNKFLSYETFTMSMTAILQASTSQYSRDRGQKFGFKINPNVYYAVPGTSLFLGSFNEVKVYAGVNKGKSFKLYAEPFANYKLNDSFALTLMYEYEAQHIKGSSDTFIRANSDLQPGFKWTVNKDFWINPYLILYVNDKVTMRNTSLNATINYRFL